MFDKEENVLATLIKSKIETIFPQGAETDH